MSKERFTLDDLKIEEKSSMFSKWTDVVEMSRRGLKGKPSYHMYHSKALQSAMGMIYDWDRLNGYCRVISENAVLLHNGIGFREEEAANNDYETMRDFAIKAWTDLALKQPDKSDKYQYVYWACFIFLFCSSDYRVEVKGSLAYMLTLLQITDEELSDIIAILLYQFDDERVDIKKLKTDIGMKYFRTLVSKPLPPIGILRKQLANRELCFCSKRILLQGGMDIFKLAGERIEAGDLVLYLPAKDGNAEAIPEEMAGSLQFIISEPVKKIEELVKETERTKADAVFIEDFTPFLKPVNTPQENPFEFMMNAFKNSGLKVSLFAQGENPVKLRNL